MYKECHFVLSEIAKINQKKINDHLMADDSLQSLNDQKEFNKKEETKPPKLDYAAIFKNTWIRNRFVLFCLVTLYIFISYYGILFSLGGISGSIYEDSLIFSGAELLAYSLSCKPILSYYF